MDPTPTADLEPQQAHDDDSIWLNLDTGVGRANAGGSTTTTTVFNATYSNATGVAVEFDEIGTGTGTCDWSTCCNKSLSECGLENCLDATSLEIGNPCIMTGTIPEIVSQMSMLSSISITCSKFTGTIPKSLATLTKLKTFDLSCLEGSGTELTGGIPDLFLLPELTYYAVTPSWQLGGTIPSSIGSANLRVLSLSSAGKFLSQVEAGGGGANIDRYASQC